MTKGEKRILSRALPLCICRAEAGGDPAPLVDARSPLPASAEEVAKTPERDDCSIGRRCNRTSHRPRGCCAAHWRTVRAGFYADYDFARRTSESRP
jgi:hypothetical protein